MIKAGKRKNEIFPRCATKVNVYMSLESTLFNDVGIYRVCTRTLWGQQSPWIASLPRANERNAVGRGLWWGAKSLCLPPQSLWPRDPTENNVSEGCENSPVLCRGLSYRRGNDSCLLSYQLLRREPQPLFVLWGRQRFSTGMPQALSEHAVPDCFVRALTSFPEVVESQNGTSQHKSSRPAWMSHNYTYVFFLSDWQHIFGIPSARSVTVVAAEF